MTKLYTTTQAAKMVGISARRVRALIEAGRVPVACRTPNAILLDAHGIAALKRPRPLGRPKIAAAR